MAGLINVYLPESWLQKQLGQHTFWHSVKAAFIGAPLPLCSCGVIPTALGLRRRGASKNATASFMVATPETGVDSIAMTYALLGPLMAIARPIAAIFSAVLAGEAVRMTTQPEAAPQEPPKPSCCGGKKAEEKTNDLMKIFNFSFGKLLADTVNWLLIGLLFAALVKTYIPESAIAEWGDSMLTMVVMILISIPMYICATASTPVAAGMLLAGVSPGSILVFMLTGPATNIATLGALASELGKKAMAAYLFGVIVGAVIAGLALDAFITMTSLEAAVKVQLNEHESVWLYQTSAVLLSLLMARHYVKWLMNKLQSGKPVPHH